MIRSDLDVFYQKRKTDFEIGLEKVRTEINFVSNLRVLVAILFLITAYLAILERQPFSRRHFFIDSFHFPDFKTQQALRSKNTPGKSGQDQSPRITGVKRKCLRPSSQARSLLIPIIPTRTTSIFLGKARYFKLLTAATPSTENF